jgi:hypothetical protein
VLCSCVGVCESVCKKPACNRTTVIVVLVRAVYSATASADMRLKAVPEHAFAVHSNRTVPGHLSYGEDSRVFVEVVNSKSRRPCKLSSPGFVRYSSTMTAIDEYE